MCQRIRDLTIKTAKKSVFPRFRHGCLIAKGGRLIAKGVNIAKPRTPNSSFSTHAEIVPLKRVMSALIRQGRKDSYEIYVARITPTNEVALSRPCSKCLTAIKESGIISFIHYTNQNGQWETVEV